jgi:hypothetical protein
VVGAPEARAGSRLWSRTADASASTFTHWLAWPSRPVLTGSATQRPHRSRGAATSAQVATGPPARRPARPQPLLLRPPRRRLPRRLAAMRRQGRARSRHRGPRAGRSRADRHLPALGLPVRIPPSRGLLRRPFEAGSVGTGDAYDVPAPVPNSGPYVDSAQIPAVNIHRSSRNEERLRMPLTGLLSVEEGGVGLALHPSRSSGGQEAFLCIVRLPKTPVRCLPPARDRFGRWRHPTRKDSLWASTPSQTAEDARGHPRGGVACAPLSASSSWPWPLGPSAQRWRAALSPRRARAPAGRKALRMEPRTDDRHTRGLPPAGTTPPSIPTPRSRCCTSGTAPSRPSRSPPMA